MNDPISGAMPNKKILITSALPYVNNVPHLGNIIGCVLSADVFSRFCKLRNYESIFICGADEYGTATEIKALEEKVTPKEICDKYYKIHKEIYEWFGIKFDIFGRTSTPLHTQITQDIFNDLHKNGFIVEEEMEQFYDEKAQMFLADRYIEGTCPHCGSEGARSDQCDKCGKVLHQGELLNPLSKVTKTTPVTRKTKHLFINLPEISDKLSEWIQKTSREGFWSENTKRIAESWLREGVKKRAITRDLKWGVPVPVHGYEDKVFYVWFDAPIGYISITANLTKDWKNWWQNPEQVNLYQFMGKDNVAFHTVIFPSTLLGTKRNWTLAHHISTTEFLNYEGGKFSKSKSIGVFGDDAMNSGIASDVWRYYLLANRPEQADTNFSWEDFAEKNNSELLANLGNLVNRTLVFINNNFSGIVPVLENEKINDSDKEFLTAQHLVVQDIAKLLDEVRLKEGLHKIMQFARNSNKYFQDNKPWELVKINKERADVVVGVLAEMIAKLSILVEPYLPATSQEIRKQLNLASLVKWSDLEKPLFEKNHKISIAKPLFKKIEAKEITELKNKHAGKKEQSQKKEAKQKEKDETNITPLIKFEDIDLEIGLIESIEKHPNAEKLYVETVKLSDGIRQIVSGLASYYTMEELKGKKVIVVKNLSTATLRGVKSEGMILAADNLDKEATKKVEVLFCDKNEIGDKISLPGVTMKPLNQISIDEFRSIKIDVKNQKVCFGELHLLAGVHAVETKEIKEGVVG